MVPALSALWSPPMEVSMNKWSAAGRNPVPILQRSIDDAPGVKKIVNPQVIEKN